MEKKIAKVTWLDAWHETGELMQKSIDGLSPVLRYSIGYLLKMTKTEVVIAAGIVNVTETEVNYCDVTVIPKGIIKGVIILSSNDD